MAHAQYRPPEQAIRTKDFCVNMFDPAPEAARKAPSEDDLAALANFRFALRKFLAFSEQVSADHGVTMQWYQALLVVHTYQGAKHISVGELAEQLMIRDHSAAELVSRLAQAKLVKRKTDPNDRRRSLVIITRAGERRLFELAAVHLKKLRESKGVFANLFRMAAEW
ncbi:MAG: MarR family winged helix-turn-helix transcriptional regulator [Methylocystis sp.]